MLRHLKLQGNFFPFYLVFSVGILFYSLIFNLIVEAVPSAFVKHGEVVEVQVKEIVFNNKTNDKEMEKKVKVSVTLYEDGYLTNATVSGDVVK